MRFTTWFGKHWRVLEQATIADLNGNGSREVAVLRGRVHPERKVNVQIRDSVTNEYVNFVGFDSAYAPSRLVVVPM